MIVFFKMFVYWASLDSKEFLLPYIPGNHAITIIYPTCDWLVVPEVVRMLVCTLATN